MIGGLGVAVAFVALALVLNSAVFTQTTATRPGPDGAAAADYGHAVRNSVAGLIAETNYYNRSNTAYYNKSNAAAVLRAGIQNWSRTVSRRNAVYGTLTNVSVDKIHNGTAIRQPYTDGRARNFTNASGATNWTLFSGANGARSFVISVNNSTNALATNRANTFTVNVSLKHRSRRLRINRTGLFVNGTQASTSAPTRVDVSNASIGGKHAPALDFFANATVTKVRFENATNVRGRYAIVANTTVDRRQYNGTVGNPPVAFGAVYDVTVRATYEGPRVTTNRTVTVAPGSPQTVVPGGDRFGAA